MKIIIILIAIFALILFVINRIIRQIGDAGRKGYRSISPVEVKKRMDAGEKVFLVDVRTPEEYAQKHIPKSLLLPLDRLEREAAQKIPDKTAPIVVYCMSGHRSANGARILANLGYTNVYNMGAMRNWPDKPETEGKNGA